MLVHDNVYWQYGKELLDFDILILQIKRQRNQMKL